MQASVRVDFLGPPGIGKTTLCDATLMQATRCDRSRDKLSWIGMRDARVLAVKNVYGQVTPRIPVFDRPVIFLRMVCQLLRDYLLRGFKTTLGGREIDQLKDGLLINFLHDNVGLVEALSDYGFDPTLISSPRAARYHDMLHWIKEWLFVLSYAGHVNILADNSRLTRGIAELLSNENCVDSMAVAERYVRSSLAPVGIVHLESPAELVVERIKKREASTHGLRNKAHEGLKDRQLLDYCKRRNDVNRAAVEFYSSMSIPVVSVDASTTLPENVVRVTKFLAEMCQPPQAIVTNLSADAKTHAI